MALTIWQKYYPQVFAALSGAVSWWAELKLGTHQVTILSATVTFGAITAGFASVSLSILTGSTRCYVDIAQRYLGWGLGSGILLACVGMVGLLFNFNTSLFTSIWCFFMVFCLVCLYRLGDMMLPVYSVSA